MIPRPLYGMRNALLRLFGATIGRDVHISNTAIVYFPWELTIGDQSAIGDYAYLYNLDRLVIGRRVTVSQRAHLCGGTHDYRDPAMGLIRRPIDLGDDAWVCADAFIGPGTSVGPGAVVGARAVAMKDVEPWAIVAGNPARFIRKRELGERVSDG
jgi:putative colanic acid biosynthesis acetyltransferase WcaF